MSTDRYSVLSVTWEDAVKKKSKSKADKEERKAEVRRSCSVQYSNLFGVGSKSIVLNRDIKAEGRQRHPSGGVSAKEMVIGLEGVELGADGKVRNQ